MQLKSTILPRYTLLGGLTKEQSLVLGRMWELADQLTVQPIENEASRQAEYDLIKPQAIAILAEANSKSKSGEAIPTEIRGKPGQAELFAKLEREKRTNRLF